MFNWEVLAAVWRQNWAGVPQLGWSLLIFALVVPLEAFFGSHQKTTWGERFGNLAAMLIHFVLGGVVLTMFFITPLGRKLAEFPRAPRHELLENPYVWAFLAVFLIDALFYVYHRAQHAIPLFWHIHKLHHTDPAMNITTSKRSHFLERALQYLCLTFPMFWILGMNVQGMTYAAIAVSFWLYAAHADIKLDLGPLTPILVGPQYHRIHHSRLKQHVDVNFAQMFPLFDILGGTYVRPGKNEYPATGVAGCDTAYSRWRPLVW